MRELIQAIIALKLAANKLLPEDQEGIDEIKFHPKLFRDLLYCVKEESIIYGSHRNIKRIEFSGIDLKEGNPVFMRRNHIDPTYDRIP